MATVASCKPDALRSSDPLKKSPVKMAVGSGKTTGLLAEGFTIKSTMKNVEVSQSAYPQMYVPINQPHTHACTHTHAHAHTHTHTHAHAHTHTHTRMHTHTRTHTHTHTHTRW